VTLIRHAYVRTVSQKQGIGGSPLTHLHGAKCFYGSRALRLRVISYGKSM
jgi:hypothetical protein